MWQLVHSSPELACVLWVKHCPGSAWQLVQRAVMLSAFGVCEWGLWQAWQCTSTWPCGLASHSSTVVLWQVQHNSASGVMGIGLSGWSSWKGPWQDLACDTFFSIGSVDG